MASELLITKLAQATDLIKANCPAGSKDPECIKLPGTAAGETQLQTILSITFGIIGAVGLIYVILAGLKFVTSQGSPEKVAQARRAIIYGAIGLAVVAMAEAVVIFVLGSL